MCNSLGWKIAPVFLMAALAPAQYLGYPTPNVPKTADGKPDLTAPAPRTADGKPDLSGMWGWETRPPCGARCGDTQISREFINIAATIKGGLPYQPWAADIVKQRSGEQVLDPNVHCMPRGAPRIWTDDYYKRIYMLPGVAMIILTERNIQYRQIFLDGRLLPQDPNPTWNGYSTGKWDGDTLVIETTGFKDGLWLDANGDPLTEDGKMIERISRPNFGTLRVEITIDDPKAYTKPWTVTLNQPLVLDSELLDYYCLENERDAVHMHGR